MKQKDKQIRELEDDVYDWKSNTIMFVILFGVLLVMVIFVFIPKNIDLREQLESCQDKVPVWTTRLNCSNEDGSTRVYMEHDFENKSVQDIFKDLLPNLYTKELNCEVIE